MKMSFHNIMRVVMAVICLTVMTGKFNSLTVYEITVLGALVSLLMGQVKE